MQFKLGVEVVPGKFDELSASTLCHDDRSNKPLNKYTMSLILQFYFYFL